MPSLRPELDAPLLEQFRRLFRKVPRGQLERLQPLLLALQNFEQPLGLERRPQRRPPGLVGPRHPLDCTLVATCSILIPAYNEVASVAAVVEVARAAALGPVLVVDDGSSDGTTKAAWAAGAEVLVLAVNRGKGGAVCAGAKRLKSEVVVLIDADLVGLTPAHLHHLAGPVLAGEVDMTRGVFSGGRWSTAWAQRIAPQLSGQRAVRRRLLLEVADLENSHYGVEVAITRHAKRHGWRSRDVVLDGVSQVLKEEKRGLAKGFVIRLGMYYDVLKTYLSSKLMGR